MKQVYDGLILNVLDHYTTVTPRLELGNTSSAAPLPSVAKLMEAAADHEAVILYKARFLTKHYLRVISKGGLGFGEGEGNMGKGQGQGEGQGEGLGEGGEKEMEDACLDGRGEKQRLASRPRAMVVCRSRAHVVLFHQYMQRELREGEASANPEAQSVRIYAAFSGEVAVPRVAPIPAPEAEKGSEGGAGASASAGAEAGGLKQSRKRRRAGQVEGDGRKALGGASRSDGAEEIFDEGDSELTDHSDDQSLRVVTESSLNGSLTLDEAHIIVVCSKVGS